MSSLKAQLQADLTDSMKSGDELTRSTLRMALTAVSTEEVAGKQARELTDDEVLAVLGREAKKRREAAEAFAAADRPELAERERAEGRVLDGYLPAQLTDEELSSLVADAVASAQAAGAEGPRAMGTVMKAVQPQVVGRADGGRVASEVKRQLGS